jgi:cytidylate kinase
MKKIIIAIDGYSATGKSSTAKMVAEALNYLYIDSGAMYRAVTYYFQEKYISLTNLREVEAALEQIRLEFRPNPENQHIEIHLNGLNVEGEIRKMKVTEMVSEVSAIEMVRKAMVAQQRRMGKARGIVMDGRDIGSVVFPDAELKIFMTASKKIRAERRQRELLAREIVVDLNTIIENLEKRDRIDSTRKEGPLVKVPEAIEIDTSDLTIEEQVDIIVENATGIIFDKEIENEY